MLEWIRPIVAAGSTWIVITLLLLVIAAGFLAHLPIRFPGPVTETERQAVTRRGLGRFVGWGRLMIALASWIGIMLLVAPTSPPETLVLRSRTRIDDVVWTTPPKRWDGGLCTPSREQRVDLGSAVDLALASLDHGVAWGRASDEERLAARHHLLDLERVPATPLDSIDDASATTARLPFPRWVIESIEISTVLTRVRTHNVRQVLVAPGMQGSVSSWKVAGAMLAARDVELCLVHPPPQPGAGELMVRRIAMARWYHDGSPRISHVVLWALIDGRTPPIPSPIKLRFQTEGAAPVEVTVPVAVDDDSSRLLSVCLGRCPPGMGVTLPAPAVLAMLERYTARPRRPVVVALNALGSVTTSASMSDGDRAEQRAELEVTGVAARRWKQLLDDPKPPYDRELLNVELQALSLRLPTTVIGRGGPRIHIAERSHWLIVANAPEGIARAERWLSVNRTAGLNQQLRVHDAHVSVNTALSWLALPAPSGADAPRLPVARAVVTAGAQEGNIHEPPRNVAAAAGLVHVAEEGNLRYVVVGGGVLNGGADPVALLATLRTIAWGASWVTNPEFGDEIAVADRDEEDRLSGAPLLRERDYAELDRRRWWRLDLIVIFLVGLHLWLASRKSFGYQSVRGGRR